MPEFDRTAYLDGFALIVSTPALPLTVQNEPRPTAGHQRARRFQVRIPIRYRLADDQEWHAGVTDNISHSGVLFSVEQAQSDRISLTGAEPGTPVDLLFEVPMDATAQTAQVRSDGRLVRIDGSADKSVAVSVRDYRLS